MKKNFLFFCLGLGLMLGCTLTEKQKPKVIGISQSSLDDAWRQAMLKEMQIEAADYDNLQLEIRDAQNDNQKQIAQIRELMDKGIDVLVISPFESEPLTAITEEAHRRGIPTIITDRKVNTDQYTTFIGADNYQIGRKAGQYAATHLSSKNPLIAEIWGLRSSSPAQERHAGFVDALKEAGITPRFETIDGKWRFDTAQVRMEDLQHPEQIEMVYSHNDVMAIAAYNYFKEKNLPLKESRQIIGVDAVPGAGLEAVADGRINASFLYPTGGEEVVRTAWNILKGDSVPHLIELPTARIDRQSAQNLLILNKRMENYQASIVAKKEKAEALSTRFRFLENSLSLILILLILSGALIIYVIRMNRKISRQNQQLLERNRREEEQSQKLLMLNNEIEQATAQKLRFFTNISHEIRTPLTLILSPVQKLIQLLGASPYKAELELIERNAQRLLRQVNQMLDFRKIENEKQQIHYQWVAIRPFLEDVKSLFDGAARIHQIHYRLYTDTIPKGQLIRMDADLMEKVLVNLLSNAFKFTPPKGKISIYATLEPEILKLSIQDSGKGIALKDLPHIFERFFSDSHAIGTGIGLHLAHEFVNLHQGQITAVSEPGHFTSFDILLPLKGESTEIEISEKEKELANQIPAISEQEIASLLEKKYQDSVLVVEDDEEIRHYLGKELTENFQVHTAANAEEAFIQLNKWPTSLIVSDVMMPGMNGFEFCRALKENIVYSHIPVILLTALSTEQQQMFGLSAGADAYISKPFSTELLKLRIIRLLENVKIQRQSLLKELEKHNFALTSEPNISSTPQNLDDLFLRRWLEQLEQIYSDADYNVEKLSETMGLSRSQLYRKIKELSGMSPVEFLRDFRLRKALLLLQQGNLHISEITYQTGFSSPAYFSKCFKNAYGITPSAYRP